MARKTEPVKPLYPVKHEFYASLDRFAHEAGMLADAVQQVVEMGKIEGPAKDILEKRLVAFNEARMGDDR